MNATYRMLLFGAPLFGALMGGLLGDALGLRPALIDLADRDDLAGAVDRLLAGVPATRDARRARPRRPDPGHRETRREVR